MPIITLDGNIGCYKTSILNYFHKNYKTPVDLEPVENWSEYLKNMYNTENSTYNFQIKVWLDRCWIQEKSNTIILMERSPYFIKNVFVEKAYEDKSICEEEYRNILTLHKTTDKLWEPYGYVYLRSNPEICFNRIKKRGREAEKNIKLEYVKRIHELHEKNYEEAFRNNKNIICIDVENKSVTDICSEIISSNVYNNTINQIYNM
jgi:deoxyadenosine/deoxycytidine kinase